MSSRATRNVRPTPPTLRTLAATACVVATAWLILPGEAAAQADRTGLSLQFEPFAGQLHYDSDLDLATQNLTGISAGLGAGPFLALRGFYWRGVSPELDAIDPVQGYGGEVQLDLLPGFIISPHLLAGAGRLDYRDGDPVESPLGLGSRNVGLLGVGVGFSPTPWTRIHLSARDYAFGDDVRRREDVVHNWLYSAGVNFRFGGRADVPAPRPVAVEPARPAVVDVPRTDTVWVRADDGRVVDRPVRDYRSGQMVEVPIPLEGEIRIRYGPAQQEAAAAVASPDEPITAATLRGLIREEMERAGVTPPATPAAPAPAAPAPAPLDPLAEQRLDLLERRLALQIEEIIARRMREEREVLRRDIATELQMRVPPAWTADVATPAADRRTRRFLRDARLYSGIEAASPAGSFVGGRINQGPVSRWLPMLDLVPEVAFGFGDGDTSLLAAANLHYRMDFLERLRSPIVPHFGAGLGIMLGGGPDSPRGGVLNLGYGASTRLGRIGGQTIEGLRLFVEHQGLQLYDRHRILVGLNVEL